jgi:tripartite-type tricarboxylate transporter receptor subunit TctC
MKRKISAYLAVLFTALGLTSTVLAAEPNLKYPIQPVKIVVPYTPGGISDLMGRSLASYLEKKWGQPVIVENKPGASEGQ